MNPSKSVIESASSFRKDRRRFLRGLGVGLSLPALESLMPRRTMAAESGSEGVVPLRTAFIYVPNGAQQEAWFPSGSGRNFELNSTMQPLLDLKQHIQVISGLDHQHAENGPDGSGDHARANATFLTGLRARKTASANIRVGQSIDQFIADHIGDRTRFSSLELTCTAVRKTGSCDSGYSCAYSYNISWRTPTTPMTPEPNPRKVFERLFGTGDRIGEHNRQLRQLERRSILDFVLEDARSLRHELGQQDRKKVDEYLSSVRDIERRIDRAEQFPDPRPDLDVPEKIPDDFTSHCDLMFDLIMLAFQTDSTRIATLQLEREGSQRTFPELGVTEGHHYLTHNLEKEHARQKVAKIDHYYMQRFAHFLQKLNQLKEFDGSSVLHNSMIVYGSGIADGNRHTHSNLPVILAGEGRGSLQAGQYVRANSVPMSNLYLSLIDRFGIRDAERFGDSTGRLVGI